MDFEWTVPSSPMDFQYTPPNSPMDYEWVVPYSPMDAEWTISYSPVGFSWVVPYSPMDFTWAAPGSPMEFEMLQSPKEVGGRTYMASSPLREIRTQIDYSGALQTLPDNVPGLSFSDSSSNIYSPLLIHSSRLFPSDQLPLLFLQPIQKAKKSQAGHSHASSKHARHKKVIEAVFDKWSSSKEDKSKSKSGGSTSKQELGQPKLSRAQKYRNTVVEAYDQLQKQRGKPNGYEKLPGGKAETRVNASKPTVSHHQKIRNGKLSTTKGKNEFSWEVSPIQILSAVS